MIDDPALPGLRDLAGEALSRMTGRRETHLLRLRYRQGNRAILHVGSAEGEGVLWFFAGDKGRHIARRNHPARLDPETGAVFEAFPNDHRLPEIAALMHRWPEAAPDLIGTNAERGLELLRYRPGLAATFRTRGTDGRTFYVKVIGDDNVSALAAANRRAAQALVRGRLRIAPVLGVNAGLRTIAYAAAEGAPLDRLLRDTPCGSAFGCALEALDTLNAMQPSSARTMDAQRLRQAARAAQDYICTMFPGLSDLTARTVDRLDVLQAPTASCQIHGDIKLEHILIDGDRTTLIDTETMALGPGGYDLAMLSGRLTMAEAAGTLSSQIAGDTRARIAARAGAGFDWCLVVVALRLAMFHAQHPLPGAESRAAELLRNIARPCVPRTF